MSLLAVDVVAHASHADHYTTLENHMTMTVTEWNDEATYIETFKDSEPGKEFIYCGATQLRYCRMQWKHAARDGACTAALRIAAVIKAEWPHANLTADIEPR